MLRSTICLYRLFVVLLPALQQVILHPLFTAAWVQCPEDDGGGICPDFSRCCPTNTPGLSACVPGRSKDHGVGPCCTSDTATPTNVDGSTTGNTSTLMTGCGLGYTCSSKRRKTDAMDASAYATTTKATENSTETLETELYCKLGEGAPTDRVWDLPRYQLCNFEDHRNLKEVYGFPIVQQIFPDEVQDETIKIPDPKATQQQQEEQEDPYLLAYYSSMSSITSKDPNDLLQHETVERVIIAIHGALRDPDGYLCCAKAAYDYQKHHFGGTDNTLILAPWFLASENGPVAIVHERRENDATSLDEEARSNKTIDSKDDEMDQTVKDNDKTNERVLRWSLHGGRSYPFRYGEDAINTTISSFAAMDAMIEYLSNARVQFPNLKRIVVLGHSAGGQFVHRWALISDSPAWGDVASTTPRGDYSNDNALSTSSSIAALQRIVTIRIVSANPRSFCYLDERRFKWNFTNFSVPLDDEIENCPHYNQWEWGLDAGGPLDTAYKNRALQRAKLFNYSIADRYAMRDVIYLAGQLDTIPLNDTCEISQFQGQYRRERSRWYFHALQLKYNNTASSIKLRHERFLAQLTPHDHCLLMLSSNGRRLLFDHHPNNDEFSS